MRRTKNLLLAVFLGGSALGGLSSSATLSGCAHQSGSGGQPGPKVDIGPDVLHIQGTPTGFVITERFEFQSDKAEITPNSEELLGEVATVLKENPDLIEVYIAGFASADGSPERNQELSLQRAHAVKSWLVAHGVDKHRIRTGGFGTTHPVGDNDSNAGRAMNRRAEFIAIKYEVNGQIVQGTAPVILEEPDVM